jgi:cation/acetate symporter
VKNRASLPGRAILLLLWLLVPFALIFFARDLHGIVIAGWPLAYWFAAQGGVLFFLLIVLVYTTRENRSDRLSGLGLGMELAAYTAYKKRLHKTFVSYVICLLLFLFIFALLEQCGLSKKWMGLIFLIVTIGLYAVIGISNRTSDEAEYFVAGRRIPAFYNGMAVAADWMSAASFISMAGGLYLQGFSGSGFQPGGLAYILGWTGGFCLVALLIAPYLRQLGLYTIPDFFQYRFGGRWPRIIAAVSAVVCSFTYLVAQIYGIGLIASRLTGVQFEIGILLGLGGVLVCSFLGGMRAVTWTQVAQYVILLLAFLIPVTWLSYKQLGNPVAPWAYGQQLQKIDEMEQLLLVSPSEIQVMQDLSARALKYEQWLSDVDAALFNERKRLQDALNMLDAERGDSLSVFEVRRELSQLPKDASEAKEKWTRAMQDDLGRAVPMGGVAKQTLPFLGDPDGTPAEQHAFNVSRLNFLALMFCLMVGTAGLPHLLTRFYTTSSVAETRRSVAWGLFFISLIYLSVPALAVMVKYEVLSHLIGQRFDVLPSWMHQWAKVDGSLLTFSDINKDQHLQFMELKLGADILMLSSPELGGFPYVISGLVAAGGLAAALSTADGLLLTIGNALTYDLQAKNIPPDASTVPSSSPMRRIIFSKFALLVTAIFATYVASQKSLDILVFVSASFSLAGAAFVPAMIMGIYWRRTTQLGAISGMLVGIFMTSYYMLSNSAWVRSMFSLQGNGLWFEIQPICAGVFGILAGVLTIFCVSLLGQHRQTNSLGSQDAI